jgi:hypothetical protein
MYFCVKVIDFVSFWELLNWHVTEWELLNWHVTEWEL